MLHNTSHKHFNTAHEQSKYFMRKGRFLRVEIRPGEGQQGHHPRKTSPRADTERKHSQHKIL